MRGRSLALLSLGGLAVVLVGVLLFGNLNGNLVYYLTPTEAVEQRADFPDGRRFRLAGQVAPGSVVSEGTETSFTVGIGYRTVPVHHEGTPPQLFREGIPVVVEGAWSGEVFVSDTIIVKHDENYAPPSEPAAEAEGRG